MASQYRMCSGFLLGTCPNFPVSSRERYDRKGSNQQQAGPLSSSTRLITLTACHLSYCFIFNMLSAYLKYLNLVLESLIQLASRTVENRIYLETRIISQSNLDKKTRHEPGFLVADAMPASRRLTLFRVTIGRISYGLNRR